MPAARWDRFCRWGRLVADRQGGEPQRGDVREVRHTRYYVMGRSDPLNGYVVPHMDVIEVEGQYAGQRYAIPVEVVAGWKVVSYG